MHPDTHGSEIVGNGLRKGRKRGCWGDISPIKPIRIASLSQQPFGLDWIILVGLEWQGEVESRGDDRARQAGQPQPFRLVNGLLVEGIIDRQADTPIVPGRLRIPLLGEFYP